MRRSGRALEERADVAATAGRRVAPERRQAGLDPASGDILDLQASAGNGAIARLLAGGPGGPPGSGGVPVRLQRVVTSPPVVQRQAGPPLLRVGSAGPEVAELHLVFSMITPLGWLERNPTFKEMVLGYKIESPSYGLLGYPTLQSADILVYKGQFVPVGKDQEAHVNMTRDLAQRFNSLYGRDVFPITQVLLTQVPKVPGTDSVDRKMSKSAGNYIALAYSEERTTEIVRTMFTDPVKMRKNDKGHPDGCVVYAFHGLYNKAEQSAVRLECEGGLRGCVDCKRELAARMNEALRPIRERRRELKERPDRMKEILMNGAAKARTVARATLEEVREVLNLPPKEIF